MLTDSPRHLLSSATLLVMLILSGCSKATKTDLSNSSYQNFLSLVFVGPSAMGKPFYSFAINYDGNDVQISEYYSDGKLIQVKAFPFDYVAPSIQSLPINISDNQVEKVTDYQQAIVVKSTYKNLIFKQKVFYGQTLKQFKVAHKELLSAYQTASNLTPGVYFKYAPYDGSLLPTLDMQQYNTSSYPAPFFLHPFVAHVTDFPTLTEHNINKLIRFDISYIIELDNQKFTLQFFQYTNL
jgi:hypothetical protein